ILLLVVSMKLSYPRFARLQQATDKLNSVVQEYLMGIRLVKAFGTYREEGERFESANQNMQKQGVAAQMIITVISPIMTLAVGLGTGLVLLFGSRLFALNLARPGDISAFIIYMAQILNSLLMITNIFNVFVRTRASTQRIAQVLRCKDDFAAQGKDPAVVSRLEVQNVTFTYLGGSGIPAIKGLSFAVTRGETLAVIGPTGSGKSTICQLLLRFYDPDSGQILLDGHPLGDYNVDLLRRSIAFVLQKPMLFTGTIAENLRYGAANAEDAQLNDALDTAQCDFVHAMPHGLDSPLGSGGVNLSGGQKQRLSLARALLKNAPILLLDDATSALDSVTEAKVRHELQQGGDRRITITVTQRCATAMFADKILVLENGGAVGFGTHRELLTHCAIYRDIYRSQLETRTEVS
ncbi:MAG: ABC transporter ATP-binding protein, partial [Angelakisella sp.]